jgi:hypothetical protein
VTVTRGPVTWAKRAFVAIVLVGAAVIPGRASSGQPQHCAGIRCTSAGSILWTAGLPGLWLAEAGISGTVPAQVGAYAATGGGVAVIGAGTDVTAFDESTGKRLWRVALTGLPAGSAVVGVRAFRQIIAVGVAPQVLSASQDQSSGSGQSRVRRSSGSQSRGGKSRRGKSRGGLSGPGRYEVMLSAATGEQIRIYPAATYGGAVAADADTTVIVGAHAITAYDNATGHVRWSSGIGPTGQAWRVTRDTVYFADTGRSPGASGSTAVRRIDLRTGAEHTMHAVAGTDPSCRVKAEAALGLPSDAGANGALGSLSDAVGNVVLFSGADGVQAFDGTGSRGDQPMWCRPSADVDLADSGQGGFAYLASGNRLLGVKIATNAVVSSAPMSVAASLYSVTNGVAFGLDENGLGEAWGYKLSTRRIVWTSASLPWPHYFVDLSGLGGSIGPGSTIALLATCTDVGPALSANTAPVCRHPELDAVRL